MRIRSPLAWLLLCCGLFFLLPSLAQAAPACTCKDKKDLLNRYREAKAAIAEYRVWIKSFGKAGYRPWHYADIVQNRVQAAINKVTDASANRVAGGTHSRKCTRNPNQVKPGSTETKCLAKTIDIHEAVHVASCQQDAPHTMDYRMGAPMADALREEIAAYETEIDFIREQLAKCPLGWQLEFDVTVFGEGSKSTNELSTISWKVRHEYKGSIALELGTATASIVDGTPPTLAQLAAGTHARMWAPLGVAKVPITVDIDDRIVNATKDPGEGESYENTTTTSTWKGKGKDFVGSASILETDEQGGLYNLTFGVGPTDATKQVAVLEKQDIDRSAYGYGGAPTHESKVLRNEKIPFKGIQLPNVGAVFNGNRVEHKKRKLELTNDSLEYTDTFPVPPSYMSGLPDVQKSLKVRVHYRITRIEVK